MYQVYPRDSKTKSFSPPIKLPIPQSQRLGRIGEFIFAVFVNYILLMD